MRTLLIITGFCIIFLCASRLFSQDCNPAALQERLSYLNGILEISWIEFDRNNIYVGFNKRPSDLKIIIHSAAINGNLAYGFGVHVWAVNSSYKGWRPGSGPYYCCATARSGKIKRSDCR